MSILEHLYYGNICPNDRVVEKESEYKRLSDDIHRREEELMKGLHDQEKELYNEIVCMRGSQENIAQREIFVDGFRLGANMMLEILTQTDRQIRPLHPLK